jgi:transposase
LIFGKKTRDIIREITEDKVLSFQLNFLMDILEDLEAKVETLDEEIKKTAAVYYQEIDILTSMKGISIMTAIAIISDIITVDRFPNAKHFASYLRSAPRVESSNEKTVIKSTSKAGRKMSIVFVSQSLNHFRDSNKKFNSWYLRLSEYKKKGILRMGLCRKVFGEIYQMMKKREYHYFRDIENHNFKMNQYRVLLDKKGIEFNRNIQIAS